MTLYRYVVRDTIPPALTITSPVGQADSTSGFALYGGGRWLDSTRTTVTVDGQIVDGIARADTFALAYALDFGMNPDQVPRQWIRRETSASSFAT